ncbi:hypothetical protein E2C01_064439 [Portunus trituberculatus]|uniref:Uncharacterized protein n=1 Tax=Portunus trituberculatus TaxID=210409 RepID=A0A5B7HLT3_PORTR|nr:hypothetical protein [Portunus trituberculatus]
MSIVTNEMLLYVERLQKEKNREKSDYVSSAPDLLNVGRTSVKRRHVENPSPVPQPALVHHAAKFGPDPFIGPGNSILGDAALQ